MLEHQKRLIDQLAHEEQCDPQPYCITSGQAWQALLPISPAVKPPYAVNRPAGAVVAHARLAHMPQPGPVFAIPQLDKCTQGGIFYAQTEIKAPGRWTLPAQGHSFGRAPEDCL